MSLPFQNMYAVLFLFIVGCTGRYHGPALSNQDISGGCALNPAMDATSCRSHDKEDIEREPGVFENIEGDSRGKGIALRVLPEFERDTVAHGTVCSLSPAYGNKALYKCLNGMWATWAPSAASFSRTKRSVRSRLIRRRVCRVRCYWFWRWRRCQKCCYTYNLRNNRPDIKCPEINDVYTDIRKTTKTVQWEDATATDIEDGEISTRQTYGPDSNTPLGPGTYFVTYQAKDKRGSTATCTEKFKVKVRTCPGIWRYGGYVFSWLYWFPHGNVDCSHGNIYGSVCTFSCDDNYELSGSSSLECQENGDWTNDRPTCVELECPDPPPVDNGQWTACSRRTLDSTCTLACASGYNVKMNTVITCQNDRTWTTPGKCEDLEVPQIQCPADISVFSEPKKQPVQVSWTVPVATDNSGDSPTVTGDHTPGDFFPVGNTTVVYMAQDSSNNRAVCSTNIEVKVQFCTPLSALSEGQINCSHGNAVGSECSFSCSSGFELKGDSSTVCLDNAQWSNDQPVCEKSQCDSPLPEVANGNFSCPDVTFFGSTCTLACSAGFTPISPLTITCNTSCQWSTAGSCKDTQAPTFPKGCPDIARYAAPLGQHTNVFFPNPEVIDNSGKLVVVTSSITSGSVFDIGSTNLTFTAVDESGNEASCTVIVIVTQVTCPDPENTDLDTTRDKVMEFDCPDGHVAGAQCCISCSDDSPLSGPTAITCYHNGTTGIGYWWYGNVKPVCNAETCPEPEVPTYGSLACDMLDDREFCVVFCQENYTFPRTDLENGGFLCVLSTGQWSPRPITSDLCFAGRPAASVEVQPDIYYYSDSCSSNDTEIRENFITIVNSMSALSDICGNEGITCDLDSVTVTCGERSKRSVDAGSGDFADIRNPRNKRSLDLENAPRSGEGLVRSKRNTHRTIIAFKIKFSFVRKDKASGTLDFYNDLADSVTHIFQDALDDGTLNIPEAGVTDNFSYGYGLPQYNCPAPTQFQPNSALCAGCGQGYIYVSQSQPCDVCPVGTYQPKDEGTECLSCPSGFTTKKDASKSEDDCLAICHPGTYSNTGNKPCDKCRRGSYQAGTGKRSCEVCPYGMSTISGGATSKNECKFYEVKLNNVSDSISFSVEDGSSHFIWSTWVKSPIDTETTFSFFGDSEMARFSCSEFSLYIHVTLNTERKNQRQWNHIALKGTGLGINGTHALYVNGVEKQTITSTIYCSGMQLTFTPSDTLEELVLVGMQMSTDPLTVEEITSMSTSCDAILPGNILTQNEDEKETLITLSTCDDTDDCKDSPCGPKQTCTDLLEDYKCDCIDQYTGDNCEIAPDYCEGNSCENNATCINHPEDENYTCDCTQGFRGPLCSEAIVDGSWSDFSAWTQCSLTCGGGIRSCSRTCDNPMPGPDGKPCEGPGMLSEFCNLSPCPVHGGLSEWAAWDCPETCGEGTSRRTRECNNPAPANGGDECVGALMEAKDCENLDPCPIDGAYGNFSDWSECSKSCGGGVTTRERTCDSPAPQYGGVSCDPDLATESKPCNEDRCPACPRLARPVGNVDSLNCTSDEEEDMTECTIVCKPGYVTDEDVSFLCGRGTNYTWSHVTAENPRGLIPDCQEAEFPEALTLEVNAGYTGVDLDPQAVSESLESKLNETVECENCKLKVETNAAASDKKRSTNGLETRILLTVPLAHPDLNLKTASDSEVGEQVDSIVDFDLAAQHLANSSDYIFAVSDSSGNGNILPDLESVSEQVETNCPAGTETLHGVCANCGAGYYSISVDSICEPCPRSFYQNNVRSTSCKTCPVGTSTAGVGARSLEECVEDPSEFYPDHIEFEGFDGVESTTTTSFDGEKEKKEDSDSSANVALIAGAIGGGVALVLLVFVIIIISFKLCNRNRPSKPRATPSMKTNTVYPEHNTFFNQKY